MTWLLSSSLLLLPQVLQVVGFLAAVLPAVVGAVVVVAQYGVDAVGCLEARQGRAEAVQLVALLVHQVAGKDDEVRLLFVGELHQLFHGFGAALPAADVDVRQLGDAVAVEALGQPLRFVGHVLHLKARDAGCGSINHVDEAHDAQHQPGGRERRAVDDERCPRLAERCVQQGGRQAATQSAAQDAKQRAEHEQDFGYGQCHDGDGQAADGLRMVGQGIVARQVDEVQVQHDQHGGGEPEGSTPCKVLRTAHDVHQVDVQVGQEQGQEQD